MANIITKRYGKIKPPLGALLDRGHPLAQGMVGGWLLNEGGGNQVLDITGNANHGTLTNMDPPTDWVGGPHGTALDFDGGNDTVRAEDSLSLKVEQFTLVALVAPRSMASTNAQDRIIDKIDYSLMLSTNDTGTLNNVVGDVIFRFGNHFTHRIGGGSVPLNAETHIAASFNSLQANIYINGKLEQQYNFSTTQATSTNPLSIGNRNDFLRGFDGILEFALIISNVLSRDPIAWLYHEPFAMFKAPGPARYFSIAAGGPFLLNVAGAMASSGSILNQPRRGWDGAMASSGLLIDKAGKIMAGSMLSSGLLSGESRKVLAGAMSSSGSLTILATRLVALAGSMVSAGAILLQPRKLFIGAMSGVGILTKKPEKVLSGAMASSGAASQLITKVIALLGSMASAGALLLRPGKVISGTMSGAGTLVKSLSKALSGAMASSGEVKKELRLIFNAIMASSGNALEQAGKLFSGAMGSSGIAALSLTRILTIAGSMVSSGVLQKSITKLLDSSMTSSGILSKSVSKVLGGILTFTGIAILQVTGQAIQIFYQLNVEAQDRIDNVEIQDRIVTVEAQKRIDTILK